MATRASNTVFNIKQVPASFTQANSAFSSANNVAPQVQPAFNTANSSAIYANGAFAQANAAFTSANNVAPQVQPAFDKANAAFAAANTKVSSSGGTVSGDLAVTGNLIVSGTRVDINTATILLNNNALTIQTEYSYQPYWAQTFVGDEDGLEFGWKVTTDSMNNIYVTGPTQSYQGAGYFDLLLAKFDTSGNIVWQKLLGGVAYDDGQSVTIDSNNNVYVSGSTFSEGGGSGDFLLAKFDTSGNLVWQKLLGGSGNEYGLSVATDSMNNIYVCGFTTSQGAGSYDLLLAKFNTSGNIVWQKLLGGVSSESGYSVAIDSNNNVYVSGSTSSEGAGSGDFLLAKFDTNGNIVWQKLLGGVSSDIGESVTTDSMNNIYVCGRTDSQGAGEGDFLLAKFDTNGNIVWQKLLGGVSNEYGYSIVTDSTGNVYVCGDSTTINPNYNGIIVKYNPSGTVVWQRGFGRTNTVFDGTYGIAIDSNDDIIITGESDDPTTDGDVLIVKLPNDGSGTGTHGIFNYYATTLTAATGTLALSTGTLTVNTGTLTVSTATLTVATGNLTSSNFVSLPVTLPAGTNSWVFGADGTLTFPDGTYANSAFDKANAAFASANNVSPQIQPAFDRANSAALYANGAFDKANSAGLYANGAFVQANSAYAAANNVAPQVQPAFDRANSAAIYANGAFIQANAAFTSVNSAAVYGSNTASTSSLNLPNGTLAQRPSNAQPGAIRYNTSNNWMEIYHPTGGWTMVSADSIYNVTVYVWGGGGGGGYGTSSSGGGGGASVGTFDVTRGTSYTITVGGGGYSRCAGCGPGPAVVGGGGPTGGAGYGGHGGGYSGIFSGAATQANAILIAGGGGGASWEGAAGGVGGGTTGGNGGSGAASGGGGGTQSAGGGGGGSSQSGSALQGGTASDGDAGGGGGGGGGYFGGGGGTNSNPGSGGGGGSGYFRPGVVSNGTLYSGSGATAGNPSEPARPANAGNAGTGAQDGQPGALVVRYVGTTARGSGGTITTSGGYVYHTFTSSGTFTA